MQERDELLETLRTTCNGQRDFIAKQAEQISQLMRSLQDVNVSSQRQVLFPKLPYMEYHLSLVQIRSVLLVAAQA